MTGYAVFGRVEAGRVVAPSFRLWVEAMPAEAEEIGEPAEGGAGTATLKERVAARLDVARETWAITTFYLFDANSWR